MRIVAMMAAAVALLMVVLLLQDVLDTPAAAETETLPAEVSPP